MTRKQTGWFLAAGAMVMTVLIPEVALAQTPAQPDSQPDRQASPRADAQDCTVPQGESNLSNKLNDCNGVLKAPESGDKGLVTPAPDTGNSRVVKPGDVPENANPSNGSGG